MAGLATLLTVALATVLALAGFAKLRRPSGTAAEFDLLGLPAPRLLARVVPLVELAVAGALLAVPAWGAVAAIALLALFTALIVGLLRAGHRVSCACFGALSDDEISFVEIVRNGWLFVAAGAALGIDQLVLPDFPAVVAASALAVVVVVTMQIAAFRRDVGTVWSTRLAGEAPSLGEAA